MRVQIAAWTIYDWQGPTSGVKLRITADDNFLARENDNSGVEVDSNPKVFREVDCTVGSIVIDGLTVKTITIPTLWLYSTNDALVGKVNARYTAKFVGRGGQEIKPLELLQSFVLPIELLSVFNPVPWYEVIRVNFPAAPVPMNMETFSTEQILDLIGGGTIIKGASSNKQVAFWSGPVTLSGAAGFEYQNAEETVKIAQQNTAWNTFLLVEDSGAANVKVGGNPSLFSSHVVNEAGLSHRAIINDGATRRWTELVKDGASGLQYSAYDNSNVLQSNTIFDPAGGIGFSDSSAEFGYFYKASSAYHLGISAAVGAGGATKEITFTTSGVGINKPTAIGSQLHVVSGAAGRIGFLVDTAGSPSQPIAVLRNNTSQRFHFNHDAVAEFGLQSVIKGRLTLAVATNTNKTSLEAADTPASSVLYKLPATDPVTGQILRTSNFSGGIATLEWVNQGGGGDVSSSIGTTVDNSLARFDNTTGKLIQDSAVVVEDTTGSFVVPAAWTLKDNNGNEIFGISPTASAVNELSFSNAATGNAPTILTSGGDSAIPLNLDTKGASFVRFLKRILMNTGTGALDNLIYVNSGSSGSVDASFGFFVAGVGSTLASDGPYFLARGNTYNANTDQRGSMLFTAGNIGSPTGNQGKIRFFTGAEVERLFIDPAGLFTFKGDIFITKDSPAITLNDSVSGSGTDFAINFNGGLTNIGRSGQTDLQLANATGVYTFGSIPVLPGSNPTTANQAARKQYVDDSTVALSITIGTEQDPNTTPGVTESGRFSWFVPDGNTMRITKLKLKYQEGSHTSGGSLEYTIRTRDASGATGSDLGPIALNNTNNTIHVPYSLSVGPLTLTAGHSVTFYKSTLSGTVSERAVSIGFVGDQKRI